MSEAFIPVVAVADIPDNGKFAGQVNGWHVLICKVDGGYVAVNDRCTHAASALAGGRIRRGTIMCPLHGARFDLATGNCMGGIYKALRMFPSRTRNGLIEVAVPETVPGMEDLPVSIG
ncbi:MAG: Rieske (2Fe-2S) protein [Sphingorhabdus sp.]